MLYIATAHPLVEAPWDKHSPAFCIQRASSEEAASLNSKFSLPLIYRIGSDEGCACAFEVAASCTQDMPKHLRENNEYDRPRVKQLRAYLRSELKQQGDMEMYFCWDEDQALPTLAEPITLTSKSLEGPFPPSQIPERTLLRLIR